MASIILPPLQALLDLQRQSIDRFGGSHGVRDLAGVEAALARAEQLIAYGGDAVTLFDVAAAIGHSICKNRHPFVDGNKRAAWFTMYVTLRLNGLYLDAREANATKMVLGVADGSRSEADLAAFLAENARAL
ncbi:type II toxin-antitoxin system death-on-curing family toxin [Sandarakinorhabdus sp.]|uniref:type II toxin-antitoxin system death-on-curing family toxin n=1 Tax=Sandarakinorhabdus sp. TaxID=1916663 RepID=UPI003F70599E